MQLRNRFASAGFLLLLTVLTVPVLSQHVELTPFIGYETGAKMSTSAGYLHADDGMNFGGALSVGPSSATQFEFSYNHMRSSLYLDEGPFDTDISDVDIDYYMFGGVREIIPDTKATPFTSLAIGWVNYRTLSEAYDNEQKFVMDLAAGVKIKASERIGIRLQARLHLPMYFNGVYFGAGTGGASMGVSSLVIMVQGDFTGSIYFVLK
jgi:hypothetical protein